MINSRSDYIRFLKREHPYTKKHSFLRIWVKTIFKPQHRFLLLLRTSEYLRNCGKGFFSKKILFSIIRYLKVRRGIRLGFSIPDNSIDEGLQLPHYGTIVINSAARIGKNARIHVGVNIGAVNRTWDAPSIGDNVYIGPGVKIFGKICVPNDCAIGANAVVNKSFSTPGMLIAGIPASEVKKIDIEGVSPRN